jgi:hypothetical protein
VSRNLLIGGFLLSLACNNSIAENNSIADTTRVAIAAKEPAESDTTAVTFWAEFQQALQEKNDRKLIMLTHFPLPGVAPFLGESVASAGADTAQFITARPEILNKVLKEQVLTTPWDSLWVITPADLEQEIRGGQILLPVIDPGTDLRMCYAQWAVDSIKETNQALVFGKIKGVYKLCGVAWRGGIYIY